LAQPQQCEPALRALHRFVVRQARERARHFQVSRHGGEREQVQLLKDKPKFFPLKVTIRRCNARRRDDPAG
jgi:hypothetical protein